MQKWEPSQAPRALGWKGWLPLWCPCLHTGASLRCSPQISTWTWKPFPSLITVNQGQLLGWGRKGRCSLLLSRGVGPTLTSSFGDFIPASCPRASSSLPLTARGREVMGGDFRRACQQLTAEHKCLCPSHSSPFPRNTAVKILRIFTKLANLVPTFSS